MEKYLDKKKMKLCDSCRKTKCNKSIVIIEQENLVTMKCVDYEKDESKIKGYKKPLTRTAKTQKAVMGLS